MMSMVSSRQFVINVIPPHLIADAPEPGFEFPSTFSSSWHAAPMAKQGNSNKRDVPANRPVSFWEDPPYVAARVPITRQRPPRTDTEVAIDHPYVPRASRAASFEQPNGTEKYSDHYHEYVSC